MITSYLNVNAFFDYQIKLQRGNSVPVNSGPINVLPPSILDLELSRSTFIPIPEEVLATYSKYRPTPLFRAVNFERAIGTDCEIYIKDESKTPTGNHKANSAFLIAHLCKKDGIKVLTTETTGNWGIALAMACNEFGLQSLSFLDSISNVNRPDTCLNIEKNGGKIIIVESDDHHQDLLKLSAEAAIKATAEVENAVYIFGSVYGYFIIAQSIMGLEAKEQLEASGVIPDFVIGSCGGGANLLGIASPFLNDMLNGKWNGRILSAESQSCPILSEGKLNWQSIDDNGYYPLIETYGLPGLLNNEYIGGLGSTIVASAAAYFHREGLIEPRIIGTEDALKAAILFERSEGIRVALETSYQLAAVVQQAKRSERKIILVNISVGENDDLFYLQDQK